MKARFVLCPERDGYQKLLLEVTLTVEGICLNKFRKCDIFMGWFARANLLVQHALITISTKITVDYYNYSNSLEQVNTQAEDLIAVSQLM